jgi:hypothetical protein
VELRAVRWLKEANKVLMKRTGAPGEVWLQAFQYLADIHNVTADETLDWRTPRSVRNGTQTDISPFIQYQFWEPITYLDSEEKFPSTKEKLGRWVGVAHNVGDFFCWKIYDETTEVIIERSVIASRLKNPNLAAEAEFKRLTTPTDDRGNESDSSCSVNFSNGKIMVNKNVARTRRLKERRQSRKKQKQRQERRMNRDTVIAGIPTTLQHCQDELVDQTLHDAALEHDLETIMEELTHSGELSTKNEVVDPGGNVTVFGKAIVPDSGGNVVIPATPPIPTSGEAAHHPMTSATVHFDTPPPPIRKDPLQPVEMLTEPPLVVRRSNRNINKPSRF